MYYPSQNERFGVYYSRRGKMIDIERWNWIINTDDMTCRNEENAVTIQMEKEGEFLRGKLRDMPIELFAKISRYENGEKIIEEIVRTAEEEYSARELAATP
jgi:hypothetical protein